MTSSATAKRRIFWLTFGATVISWISLKIVLPALPGLSDILNTDTKNIKLSVSLYLMFFALTQPIWGGIIQRMGVKKTIYFSFAIAAAGSLIAMLSGDIYIYILGRSMEGIGMGAFASAGRKMLVDYFDKKELVQRIGMIAGVSATMPAIGPIIGGYLMKGIDWRAIFALLLLLTLAYIVAFYLFFPKEKSDRINEKNSSYGEEPVTFRNIVLIYFNVIRNIRFWGFSLALACMLGGILGYFSAMPFWYHSQHGIPVHVFSYLAIPTVGLYIAGLYTAAFLVKKYDVEQVLVFGIILATAVTGIAVILGVFLSEIVIALVVIMSLYGFAAGLVVPNTNAGLLTTFKLVAAPASALGGLVVFGTSSVTSYIAMNISVKESFWPLVIYIGVLTGISIVVSYFWIYVPYKSRK